MNTMVLNYVYSTKNFHRFSADPRGGAVINEVYVPRDKMPQAVAALTLTTDWNGQPAVLEKVKPAKV